MIEPRPYTPQELLAWCRLLTLTLTGAAMTYAREQEGSIDGFVELASQRLSSLLGGASVGAIEPAMLGLLLNSEAVGGEILSRAVNPEEAEAVVADLPGQRVSTDLEDRFEVSITPEQILEAAGVSQDDLNRLFDIFGAVAASQGFEFAREETAEGQRLLLRVW